MPVIVVGGSNKSVGKTWLICGVIAAFPELGWTAVKITSHRYGEIDAVWEESTAGVQGGGQGTDTARFLAAGARRALLVSASETGLAWREMKAALGAERNVIYESNRVAEEVGPDICLAMMSGCEAGFKASFAGFLNTADAVIAPPGAEIVLPDASGAIPVFRLAPPDEISQELIEWLRDRMGME